MEAIKISVEVSVNLSENTQNFIKSLFTSSCGCHQPVAPVATPASSAPAAPSKPASTAPAAPQEPKKPTAPAVAPAQAKPAATPALSAPATPTASSVSKTIEDVRKMLSQKVNEHRDAIKQKLNELGAPSVTKLDPSKYDEMYDFLNELHS